MVEFNEVQRALILSSICSLIDLIDRSWLFRVLKRVAANFDQLSGNLFPTEESEVESNPITAGVKLRHRLAEPEPEFFSLSHREQRAILREKMSLPPM